MAITSDIAKNFSFLCFLLFSLLPFLFKFKHIHILLGWKKLFSLCLQMNWRVTHFVHLFIFASKIWIVIFFFFFAGDRRRQQQCNRWKFNCTSNFRISNYIFSVNKMGSLKVNLITKRKNKILIEISPQAKVWKMH